MHAIHNLSKSVDEEELKMRFAHISLLLLLGAAVGAAAAMYIAPRSKSIRMTLEDMGEKVTEAAESGRNKTKEFISEAVETGQHKGKEILHEGEKKFEEVKHDMKEKLRE